MKKNKRKKYLRILLKILHFPKLTCQLNNTQETMKKTLLFTVITLLGMSQAVAEEYEYVPFVREGVKWVYYINNSDLWNTPDPRFQIGLNYRTLELKGDVVINGKAYKAMHKYSGDAIDQQNDTIPIYLREDNKVVYGIIPEGRHYYDCPINISWLNDEYNGQEFVLYDFNDQESFWNEIININEEDDDFELLSTDIISLGTHRAKRYINRYGSLEFYMVEGVGIDWPAWGYTLSFFMSFLPGATFHFSHVIEDGNIIYKGFWYDSDNITGIDEVVADQRPRQYDDNYYNMMGQPVGNEVPTTPGIYIHQGKKICVGRMP